MLCPDPRLEGLVEQLQLSKFEKNVILYLAGSMISPIFKQAVGEDGGMMRYGVSLSGGTTC
eukprot:COSAG05_NODE_8643_length_685_cov_0.866894_1_plen_61_part_00